MREVIRGIAYNYKVINSTPQQISNNEKERNENKIGESQ